MANPNNLLGTARTLDRANGSDLDEPIGEGLISRDGWALVDDSRTPLFDSSDFRFARAQQSPWPWVTERAAGERQDWYFFGYGHDYKAALVRRLHRCGRTDPIAALFCIWSLVVKILAV